VGLVEHGDAERQARDAVQVVARGEVAEGARGRDAARAEAEDLAGVRARDRLRDVERLDDAARVGVQVPVAALGVRVAPRDDEDLLARGHEVLDHAALGRDVDDVELVDHRRDDHERLLAHLLGGRPVLDELERRPAQDDGARA
jgi:hypothetical protein